MNGVWFDDIHSVDDLNLVLSEVNIPPASVKTMFVDIPGGDGSADLTEALGEPRYNDRECNLVFTVFPYEDFEVKKRELSALLNGKRKLVVLDKDPDFQWDARCRIDEYRSDRALHQIVVGMICKPYKMRRQVTTVVQTLTSTARDILLQNGRKTVLPSIHCTNACTLVFNGDTFALTAGTHRVLGIQLIEGMNLIKASGSGTVTFTYTEGEL